MSDQPLSGPDRTTLGAAWTVAGSLALLPTVHRVAGGAALVATLAVIVLPYGLLLAGLRRRRISWWMLAGAAAAARLALIPETPVLSDDIYRYLWDGRVGWAGLHPFRYAPAAEALAPLRDAAVWPQINHREIPTIYPPGAQYLFQLNAALGGGVVGMKSLIVVGESALIAASGWLWHTHSGSERPGTQWVFAAYALNPLVVVETAWSGHVDTLGWALVFTGLLLWECRRGVGAAAGAGLAIGASIAVKLLALLALPLIAFDGRGEEPIRRPTALAAAGTLVLALCAPFAGAGDRLFTGFGTYADSWRGNDGLYRAARTVGSRALNTWAESHPDQEKTLFRFESLDAPFQRLGWTTTWNGRTVPATTFAADELAGLIAKVVASVAVGLALLWGLLLPLPPLRSFALAILVLYLFAPILHPWYVAWLVPFAAATDSRTLLTFSATVLIGYLSWLSARRGGPWHVPDAAVAVEYGIVLAVAALETIRGEGLGLPTGGPCTD